MRQFARSAIAALALIAAGCGSGGSEDASNVAAAVADGVAANDAATVPVAAPALPACPFRETEWQASVTGGALLVNGRVDIMMAGFRPTLTRRDDAPGAFAFDLALVPEPGAVVDEDVRYEGDGSARHRRAEIHCGGERIATVDVVLVAD